MRKRSCVTPVGFGWGGVLRRGFGRGEVAFCFGYVAADLFAEGFGVGPADFGAEAVEEGQGEGCLFVEFDWVEVQEVGFYGEGVGAEGGAVAYVGDGFEGFAVGTGFGVGPEPMVRVVM